METPGILPEHMPAAPASPQKFSSPEEELKFLREQVAMRERELASRGAEVKPEEVISDKIRDYAVMPASHVLVPEYQTPGHSIESLALNLSPEPHDAKMAELLDILKQRGIKNALSVADALNDAHVEDDFHRFLVQYIKKGYEVRGLSNRSELFHNLAMTLYEISLPDIEGSAKSDQKEKPLKEILSQMEQFYAGMLSLEDSKSGQFFSLEVANPNHSEEFIFYVSVPDAKKNLFEKQFLSLFPTAKIREMPDDYNIFNENGMTVGAVATLAEHPVFPLKTYDQFDFDPLNVVLNTFSKIKKDGEGAALQVIFRPPHDTYVKNYKYTIDQIQKGVPVKKALPKSVMGDLFEGVKDVFFGSDKKDQKEKEKPAEINEAAIENIRNKIGSPMAEINIRVLVSANTDGEAEKILSDIESGFNQFENAGENKIIWKRMKGGKLRQLAKDFSFRTFSTRQLLPLNFKELTTMFHFPATGIKSSPQLRQSKAGQSAAPIDLPQNGTLLGLNRFRNMETKVFMTKEDRLRHFYTIGQTGTGKSTLLKNMIAQDILQGEGVCMIDPHGVDIVDILSIIPPARYEDVIYFDPSYTARPMALNMLEYDRRYPEQKTFVVNEMLSIFNKLFDMKVVGGPMFEQYFRNAVMLVIEDPETGCNSARRVARSFK